ncbi:MAG: TetR family transcriptional regulator [Candidatus Eremiobacteraeota bacterium]|nr:TetR family transcriptional regulator [Candidatus Eremiobacteraeota bacterium]
MLKRRTHDLDDATERIRKAAIALFKTRGYHGTPVRALAEVAKIEAGSLYYHFPSKQQILFDNFVRTMDTLLEGLDRASETESTPQGRLRAAVRAHVLFHTRRQAEAFISHTEIRALTEPNRRKILLKRDRYEERFRVLLQAGVDAGIFRIPDVRLTNIAILTMCSGVADWFFQSGRLDAELVAERYVEMVERLVGYSSSGTSGDRKRAPSRRPKARR